MAKDSAQSRIPRLDGVTRLPVSTGSIRIPTATAHHHHFQKAQLISSNVIGNNKMIRPSTFTGLHPSSMASIRKSLSGERIAEAACIMGKKTATTVKKFLTKPEKLSPSVPQNYELPVKMITKDETIILDKGMKNNANQKLMSNIITTGQQEQQQQQQHHYDNKFQQQTSTTGVDVINTTRTLTRSETFVRDKNDDDNDENNTHNKTVLDSVAHNDGNNSLEISNGMQHQTDDIHQINSNTITIENSINNDSSLSSKTRTIELTPILGSITVSLETDSKLHCDVTDKYSNERLSDISIPSCDLDVTLKPHKQHKNYGDVGIDDTEEFENDDDEGHGVKIDSSEDFDSTLTLAPDKGEAKVINSTMMTERLLDITSNKLSPSQQLMNLTRDLNETYKCEQNNTKLLYMSHNEINSPSALENRHHLNTTTNDEPMEVDEQPKTDENIFDIPSNLTQVLNSRAIQELKQNKPRYSFGLDLTEFTLDCSIDLCDVSLPSSTAQASSPSLKKQNSFEMDESLGILTPDQMKEFLDSTTTTTNLDLPINMQHRAGSKLSLHQMRIDQTPSPEDLPLDPVGVKTDVTDVVMNPQPPILPVQQLITYQEISQTDTDSKTDQMTKSSASKVSNSFITSVTSITSLDTGYQGDGEMSRPASRGPIDHSPSNGPRKPHLGRQPSFNHNNPPNIPIRRQDPMTDSDFFTESDADDIFHRGDRRAQVIDGQLYGPMLQPANVFITEQPHMEDSCMESSGIFTDVENRCDDELSRSRREADIDMSPDGSTDTVKSNNAEFINDNAQKQQQLSQSCVSPIDQNNSNILTDSQTSSTIQSSLSSELIGGSACSIGTDCSSVRQQQKEYQQLQFKRNATISGAGGDRDVTISTSLKSLSTCTNSSSTGALNVNLTDIIQNEDNHDDKKLAVAQNQQPVEVSVPIVSATSSIITQNSLTSTSHSQSTPSISSPSLVKKVSPSRKQQAHNVGDKYENKSNISGNLTKTGIGSISVVKSANISGNSGKNLNQFNNENISVVSGGNNDDNASSISSNGSNTGDMLEKSGISRNIGSNGGSGNQENKRPGYITTATTPSNNVTATATSQISPTTRKINKWDAVMNKIAENKSVYKKNYSDVKSKVASGVLKRSKQNTNLIKSPHGGQSQTNSNCGSLNSVSGLSSPKTTPTGKRLLQGATKRGRSYSKDSQRSSQSDLSLSGGSPKLYTKLSGNTRSAKKRDVRTLSISPTDLGPPPKSQTNASSRTKQSPQVLSQKRFSSNVQQTSSVLNSKSSPPPAKKAITRRPQAQQQSHTKTPLKDHNRLISQTQSQQQQQQIQQLNGSPKTAVGIGIKGVSSPSLGITSSTPLQVAGGGLKPNSRASLTQTPTSPILDDNNLTNNTTPTSILHSVQSHKKHHLLLQQQQQQKQQQNEQELSKEATLELHLAHANKSVEALGVLLQYLAYDLDAFACPSKKKDYANTQKNLIETRLLLEEAKTSCHELQDQLQDKEAYYTARESELQALHRCELKKVESSLNEFEANAKDRIAALENELATKTADSEKRLQEYVKQSEQKFAQYEAQIHAAKEKEQELLKQISVLSSKEKELKDEIKATENCYAERLKVASQREHELVDKINALNKQLDELRQKTGSRERELEDKLNLSHDEISILRLSKSSIDPITSSPPKNGTTNLDRSSIGSANKVQMLQNEVESLRSVLELKQSEVSELRIKKQEMERAAEELPAMQMKISALETRIEDLQIQLKAKAEEEKELLHKNKHLQESLTHEVKNRNRLTLHNEELQWRLKQNSEKFALTLAELSKSYQEQVGFLNSSVSKTSINSQENLDLSHNSSLLGSTRMNGSDRCMTGCFEMDDVSPPASPIIKGVVEKSDSVSWVLEMDDETPEVLASRMVRRAGSFRSSFSEKSPGGSTKRQYSLPAPAIIVNPLTQSASATSVLRQHSNESANESPSHSVSSRIRSKSVTIKSPEQKKIIRQSSIGSNGGSYGTSSMSSRKSEPPLSSSWKDPIYCSSPYTRRPSNSRSPPKDATSHHLLVGVASSSSASKSRERADSFNTDNENGLFNKKHEPNLITCDTSALTSASERIEMRSLPTHPSVQDLKNLKKCQQEIQESAGEAMVSGTNSEDEGCSGSSDEAVSSASSSTSTSSSSETDKQHNMSIDCMLIEKINCSLGSTPMEVSWSDDGDQFPSESIV